MHANIKFVKPCPDTHRYVCLIFTIMFMNENILKFLIFEQIMKICGNLIIFLNSKNYMLEKTIWKTF